MLAIRKSPRNHHGKCTPNVLPCRINHNGAVDASRRYWNPVVGADNKPTSYFRGRKLYGKKLKIPKGYRGVLLTSTDRLLPPPSPPTSKQQEQGRREEEEDEDDGEAEKIEEVKIWEEQASFEEIVVWGHEVVVDAAEDPYVRGLEEWIGVAGSIHSYNNKASEKKDP